MASSGAAPLPEEVWAAMRDRAAVTVWEGYGLTEASPVVASTLATGRAKPNCIGGPVPGVELELRDTATTDGEHDTTGDEPLEGPGEIWVRGPNLFSGYWPDGADGPGEDGWLGTGDLAYRDADGDLHLVDRRSDLILVSGFNVYPAEVERVIALLPEVDEVVVVGAPHDKWGETVTAVISLRPGRSLTADRVVDVCRQHLAPYKKPTAVHFVEALPKTSNGKLWRRQVRDGFWIGRDRQVGA